MNSERWRQVEEIFQAAVDVAPDQRPSFLELACAGDTELRGEVESLLAREDDSDTFLTTLIQAASQSLSAQTDNDLIGQRIGAYRVTGLIGEGGMAEVFKAVRDDDQYQKQVAIKLIRRGMVTGFMLGRFRHERQILATLEHPNVARLLEGGATEEGLPYLVMEYVDGQPITDYCKDQRLSVRQRLKLFLSVCEAVQYAHRNLIIHRDLKPSNVLVTKDCAVKLLDFGIAKLLSPEVSPGAVTVALTMKTARLMTPHYASPEQVRGETVTTATDVYSLGAMLYELLTGERPHRFKNHTIAEMERVICEVDVEKPSAVVRRQATPRLRRALAGDLDNIVLMAMRKEPERRYESVAQLAEEIRRHLQGRTVKARQDTLGYRASKFVRRHKVGVGFSAALVVLLVALAVTMALQAARVAKERDRANQVTNFLIELFGVSDPSEARGSTITAREILDKGAERIERELEGHPEAQAEMMAVMGRVYQKLGLYEEARPLLEEALATRRQVLGAEHANVASSLSHLAELMHAKGELEKAEQMYRDALAIRRRLLGAEHADVASSLHSLAILLKDRADYEGAEPLFNTALAMRRRLFGDEHPEVAATINELAVLLKQKGDYAAAEPLYRQAVEMRRRLLGEDHPDVAISLNNLAVMLDDRGRYEESEAIYRQALALSRKVLGEEHPHVATGMSNLAGVLKNKGDYDGAEPLYRQALGMKRRLLGKEHQEVAVILNNLAGLLRLKGDYKEAEALFRESLEMKRKLMGGAHPSVATGLQNLAGVLLVKGDYKAAEPLLKEALEITQKSLAPDHWMQAEGRSNYGACMTRLGNYQKAEEYLLSAHAGLRATLGDHNRRTQKAAQNIVELYEAWGKPDKAAPYRALLPR